MTMTWEKLKTSRPKIFGHPKAPQLTDELWKEFIAQNAPDHDAFARWITTDVNWPIFIRRFNHVTGFALEPSDEVNPNVIVQVDSRPEFLKFRQPPPPPPPLPTVALAAGAPAQSAQPSQSKSWFGNRFGWKRPSADWSPAQVFHDITGSSREEQIARLYDWGTNLVGLPQLAMAYGLDAPTPLHTIVYIAIFILGALLISYMEVIALQALAKAVEMHEKRNHPVRLVRYVYFVSKVVFFALFVFGMLLWVLDFYLSVLPWANGFGGNPVGWLTGLVLSIYVEYVELSAHVKALEKQYPVQPAVKK
jgi:hypothetical protein